MKKFGWMHYGPVLFFILLMPTFGTAQQKKTRAMTGSAAKGGAPADLKVAADLGQWLAKFQHVRMPFQTAGLTAREQQLVRKLVEACGYLESIYWRQSDAEGLTLYQSLGSSRNRRDIELRTYLRINASRFDLLDQDRPFVGTEPAPPGRGFYPANLTRDQVEQYVKQHPEQKAAIYNQFTIVRWNEGKLEAVPYRIAFRAFLEPAAQALRAAANLSDDAAFAQFLQLRADALLSDDYFPSDLAWLELKNPKFDIVFAPYETYLDGLLGVKGSYGAAVMVRNERESKKLELFQKYVPQIQDALPLAAEDRPSKQGLETPMEVMDTPFRAGDLTHGYQAVADNLPNDPRVHEQKGSKKLFFKNFMDARVNYIILPVARKLMEPKQAAKVSGEGYLLGTIMHEICHGLGPAFARTAAGKVSIREAIGPGFSGLEEAKADVTGMFGLKWLVDHDALPKAKLEEYYASYVGELFRTVRFGTAEAHGQAEMMEFNYLSERGAIQRNTNGRYSIDYEKIPGAVADLAKELLEIEATGDRARAENWFKKYDTMPEELKVSLKAVANVPVDIDPVFSFAERVK
ncbi:Zn-dependent hydrolase [Candidatus Sulfotelmatobacter kueseliae]|uniref:Zn-dependent hydrolase n=1 Tax=Candidatus Sulfotelmatobacter kueseliae TaxID=2042962 RepID=A0A2U3K569_9BACT|nr:Zn-dependent hydrolase [Candidatus Sulfotelmatobacter kueseliae]